MTAYRAWRDGVRRVGNAPSVLLGVWLMSVLASLPLALVMRSAIEQHLGASLAAETAASGTNYRWMQEFSDQAPGPGTTFRPTIIGFGAVLDNLSAFADRTSRPPDIVAAAAVYVVLWLFVAGGVIDRYARDRATRAHGFFSACGVFFFRFLRLAVVVLAVYAFFFAYVHPWLFGSLYPKMTRDLSVERTAFLIRAALYVVFGLALAAFNLLFDYAKVRAVVEDRRSMLGAVVSAWRFIRRNASAVTGLYLLDAALFLGAIAVYALVAPGAGRTGWSMWMAFAVGQLYVLARLWVKLVFWASEAALFQSRLAHAGYVAAAKPTWPDSPAAEAIRF